MSQFENVELYGSVLFLSKDELEKKKLPKHVRDRVERIRVVYHHWARYPNLSEKEIRDYLIQEYQVPRSVAYEDFWLIKNLMGSFQQSSKDYHRWRFNQLIMEQYYKAAQMNDVKNAIAALSSYARFNKLDLEDNNPADYSLITPQTFEVSNDPTTIGIRPVKDLDDKVRKLIKKYNEEDISNIDAEDIDVDFNIDTDDAFKPNKTEQLMMKFDDEEGDNV